MVFSILFLSITNNTARASTFLGKKEFTVDYTFPALWSSNSLETIQGDFYYEKQVIFSDICTLRMDKYYQFNFDNGITFSAKNGSATSSGNATIKYYILINGEKHYLQGWSSFIFQAPTTDVFIFGAEVHCSIQGYWLSSASSYTSTYIQPSIKGSGFIYISELTDREAANISGSSSVVDGLKNNKDSIDKGNDLQSEQNETSKGILGKITDFFGSFFENLKGLFVPEDGYFSDFFTRLNDFFSDKLGMLYAPIDMFITFLNTIKDASSTDSGITFPELAWDGTVIIPETKFSFSTITKDFPDLQEKIYFVTDVILVGAVLWLLQIKLKEVLEN